MLDCKMTSSLSPITPINILSESYMGIWEQDAMNPPPTKLETSDLMDLIEPNMSAGTNSPTTTIHHGSRDCHFQSSQYLTPLPPLGDPYCSSECQMPESFYCMSNLDTTFHKFPEGPPPFSNNYDNFLPDFSQHQSPLSHHNSSMHSHNGGLMHSNSVTSHVHGGLFGHHMSPEPNLNLYHPLPHHEYIWDDLPCEPGDYIFMRKGDSPTTSDSVSYGDIDSEVDSKSSGGSLSALTEICHVSPPKRKVGRPPKKDKKLKRNEKKTGRLWEFIRDLLKNPEYCPSLVRWENPEEGHFRFVNSEKVAQLWGQIKGNPRMTYEKLSRAMRYYYKSHVFEPVLGRRLVYKFGHNAVNWRPVNPNFVTVQKLFN